MISYTPADQITVKTIYTTRRDVTPALVPVAGTAPPVVVVGSLTGDPHLSQLRQLTVPNVIAER